MITLKLLIFALILLGPSAFAYAKAGARLGRTLPAVLCGQGLLLIALGYFLPFSVGMGALAAVSAAAWIYALTHIRDWRRAVFALLVPTLIFAVSAVFLYDACARRIFLSYDEHSHWGLIVKVIHHFDGLPRMGRGASYIQYTYPPFTAMLPAMAGTLLGYRDGVAYLGYAMLIEGLLWGLAAKVSRGVKTLASCALVYLMLMVVFPMGILRLFAEPVIALLMALLILGAFEDSKAGLWEDCLLAAALAMTKNTGLVFVAIALAVRLCVRCDRRTLAHTGGMLAISLMAVFSYSAYCSAQGIEALISPSHFAENMSALFQGTLSEAYAGIPARFAAFLFTTPLPQSGVYACYGFGTVALVLGMMLALCAAHAAIAKDRRQALRFWGGLWAANIAYLLMIAASYFFNFEPEEAARLAEADRYTILVALWTGLLAVAMLIRESGRLRAGHQAALLCALAAVMLPVSHPEMTVKTFITREYVDHTIWGRAQTDRMSAFIVQALGEEENTQMLCIGDHDYAQLHHTLAGTADIGPIGNEWWRCAWRSNPEKLREALAGGSYAYVFAADMQGERELDGIDARYGALTADGEPVKDYSLYRVEHGADGSVTLRYLASMPDQET
ncbi:MAG: hypothetical protein E7321_01630 [Clostridiales bacterium]|nr:hypothetical protein [Clostridiales bacterium]